MGETTKNSTPQTSTIEAEFQYQNPDVTAAAESLTLEEKLLPLIEMLTSNDEELKSMASVSSKSEFVVHIISPKFCYNRIFSL
jgi:hypothetical protein